MGDSKAEKIVINSLKRHGASCATTTNLRGEKEIIVSWNSDIWRILVKNILSNDEKLLHLTAREAIRFHNKAQNYNQIAVVAWVYSDGNIEYRAIKDDTILQPQSLVNHTKTKIIKKELHE